MARLFDKNLLTTQPTDLLLPYISKPPPSVRVIIIPIIFQHVTDIFCWLAIQDLYPDREVDAELSDEDNIRRKEPTSDDAEGEGAPSVETLTPNPIGSSVAEESRPLAANWTTIAAPSSIGKRKKRVALGTKCMQDQAPADQVIIELPPYHGPQSPLDLVAVEHIFGRLFEAF
jgi:hypothetical protein